jgi:hypothetical protein
VDEPEAIKVPPPSTTWYPVMFAFAAAAVNATRRVPVDVTEPPGTTLMDPLVGAAGTEYAVTAAVVTEVDPAAFTDVIVNVYEVLLVRPEQSWVAVAADRPVAEQPAGVDEIVCDATGAAVVEAGAVQVTRRVAVAWLVRTAAEAPVGAAGALIAVAFTEAERTDSAPLLYEATVKS